MLTSAHIVLCLMFSSFCFSLFLSGLVCIVLWWRLGLAFLSLISNSLLDFAHACFSLFRMPQKLHGILSHILDFFTFEKSQEQMSNFIFNNFPDASLGKVMELTRIRYPCYLLPVYNTLINVVVSLWIFTAMPVSVCPVSERLSRAPPGPRGSANPAPHSDTRFYRRKNGPQRQLDKRGASKGAVHRKSQYDAASTSA